MQIAKEVKNNDFGCEDSKITMMPFILNKNQTDFTENN